MGGREGGKGTTWMRKECAMGEGSKKSQRVDFRV